MSKGFDKLSPNGEGLNLSKGFDRLSPNGEGLNLSKGFDRLSPNGQLKLSPEGRLRFELKPAHYPAQPAVPARPELVEGSP